MEKPGVPSNDSTLFPYFPLNFRIQIAGGTGERTPKSAIGRDRTQRPFVRNYTSHRCACERSGIFRLYFVSSARAMIPRIQPDRAWKRWVATLPIGRAVTTPMHKVEYDKSLLQKLNCRREASRWKECGECSLRAAEGEISFGVTTTINGGGGGAASPVRTIDGGGQCHAIACAARRDLVYPTGRLTREELSVLDTHFYATKACGSLSWGEEFRIAEGCTSMLRTTGNDGRWQPGRVGHGGRLSLDGEKEREKRRFSTCGSSCGLGGLSISKLTANLNKDIPRIETKE